LSLPSKFRFPAELHKQLLFSFAISDAMLSVVVARIVGVNMLRCLLYTALALNFSSLAVTATDRYGGWLLEQPRSSVRTLSFKQTVQLNNKIETLELGFICDQRKSSKNVGVILIPFNGTFQNDRNVVPVLIQKNADQYDPSDLLQNWKNGVEYIFSEAKDDVDGLVSFMKADEMDGAKSVYFIFSKRYF
jgi:hypothetical protein